MGSAALCQDKRHAKAQPKVTSGSASNEGGIQTPDTVTEAKSTKADRLDGHDQSNSRDASLRARAVDALHPVASPAPTGLLEPTGLSKPRVKHGGARHGDQALPDSGNTLDKGGVIEQPISNRESSNPLTQVLLDALPITKSQAKKMGAISQMDKTTLMDSWIFMARIQKVLPWFKCGFFTT